ncbi:MAG TPA: 6-phosphofructokinase [Stellaceae bacterium]|nr:6-phosphofructokinase [Stellaceae bacterium]
MVINQSLVGAVLEARLFPQVERIYDARYGVRGIVNEDFSDLSTETRANLEAVAATPSSALGSTRDRPDLAYCRNIVASLKAHGVAWFLYIGGNDTADTVRIVSEEAARKRYDLRCIHIPILYESWCPALRHDIRRFPVNRFHSASIGRRIARWKQL